MNSYKFLLLTGLLVVSANTSQVLAAEKEEQGPGLVEWARSFWYRTTSESPDSIASSTSTELDGVDNHPTEALTKSINTYLNYEIQQLEGANQEALINIINGHDLTTAAEHDLAETISSMSKYRLLAWYNKLTDLGLLQHISKNNESIHRCIESRKMWADTVGKN